MYYPYNNVNANACYPQWTGFSPVNNFAPYATNEISLQQKIDFLSYQLNQLTAMLQMQGLAGGYQTTRNTRVESSLIKIRETDTFVCWEIPLLGLSLSDLEVEVFGSRIVCRTKTPVSPSNRFWNWAHLPNNFQITELPDGRVECVILVNLAFDPKTVEAVYRDNCVTIFVPRLDVSERHNVRIGKEAPNYVSGNRKGAAA